MKVELALRLFEKVLLMMCFVGNGKAKKLEKYLEVDFPVTTLTKYEENLTTQRMPSSVPVLELGLFVTSDLEKAFYDKFEIGDVKGGNMFISTLLTNYLKGLYGIFSDESLQGVKLRIVITRVEIVPEKVWSTWKGLSSFCLFQSKYSDIDTAILVIQSGGAVSKQMRVYSLGQTYRAGVCSPRWRCGLVQENVLLYSASRRLIAHEIAHSIGLADQGRLLKRKLLRSKSALRLAADRKVPYDDLTCMGAEEGLMTDRGETWLNCSVHALRNLLRSESTKCLYKQSGHPVKPDGTFVGLMKFIGRKEMCTLYLNTTSWIEGTKVVYDEKAEKPLCRFGQDECMGKLSLGGGRLRISDVSGQSWPTGTMCSEYVYDKLCYHGECVPFEQILDENDAFIREP